MIRLFTALEIPDEVAEKLRRLQQGLEGARWIERADLHITLRFIGDVAENIAADIDEALAFIPFTPFEIELEGVGEFGGARPNALWAGVRMSDPLRILQGRHESAMRRVGLKPETRKFHPHVTVARITRASVMDVGHYIEANNLFAAPRFTAEHFTLFSARAGSGGGPYVAERRYPEDEWEDGEG